ncbi:MAG TPA: hypothetical protein VEA77_04350 [Hyphomicrobium sp.]|nr:hypothetical protein [Hyphomicrobium sp.]
MLGFVPLVVWPNPASAGEKDKAGHEAAPAKPAAANGQAAPVLPDADKIVLLVRTTLLTINDAVQTGNFTVLRDKAAPSFRDGTTPTSLGKSLDSLAQQRIDLSAVAIIAPQLTELPAIDESRRLKLKGYFPGQPVGIGFDLTFEVVQGSWRLFALSVGLVKAPIATSAAPAEAKKKTP